MSAVRPILLMPAKFGSLWHTTGMADPWGMSFFPSPEAFWAFYSFLWLLLLAFVCFSMMPRAKPQVGGRAGAEAGPAWQGEGSAGARASPRAGLGALPGRGGRVPGHLRSEMKWS